MGERFVTAHDLRRFYDLFRNRRGRHSSSIHREL